jgi:hypothetical protein
MSDWNKILPLGPPLLDFGPLLHAPDHISVVASIREALPSNNKLLTFKPFNHGDSIVHMYPCNVH